eukprot:TRINITY_DN9789_c0_g1_i1.p1 TRINITY_DN9789_c0_g1~~TRINITY_DN9789_c0_g1_i1.p1  ORF type:complete len:84 (+),score=13.58 TRINITY_DN9789_c0_g1_i1:221-472(+)
MPEATTTTPSLQNRPAFNRFLEATLEKLDIVYNINGRSTDDYLNQAIVDKKSVEKRFCDLMEQKQRAMVMGKNLTGTWTNSGK